MGKVERYTDEMIAEYTRNGFWTPHLTVDFWEANAATIPDEEALVDSEFRCGLTVRQVKDIENLFCYRSPKGLSRPPVQKFCPLFFTYRNG